MSVVREPASITRTREIVTDIRDVAHTLALARLAARKPEPHEQTRARIVARWAAAEMASRDRWNNTEAAFTAGLEPRKAIRPIRLVEAR